MPGKLHLVVSDAKDNVAPVKHLIEQIKADPSLTDENNITPIEYAVKSGNFEIIKYLLEKAKVRMDHNHTPNILELASSQAVDIRRYLVNHCVRNKTMSELAAAVYLGQMEKVHNILTKEPHRIMEKDGQGRTLFYWAALLKHENENLRLNFLTKHKAFTNLREALRDELWRNAAKASFDDAYEALLEIKELTDDDNRHLAEVRFRDAINLDHLSNIEQFRSMALRQKEMLFDFAIDNLNPIQHKNDLDFYNLAKYVIERARVYVNQKRYEEATVEINTSLASLINKKLLAADYPYVAFVAHAQLAECYSQQNNPLQAKIEYEQALAIAEQFSFTMITHHFFELSNVRAKLSTYYQQEALLKLQLGNKAMHYNDRKESLEFFVQAKSNFEKSAKLGNTDSALQLLNLADRFQDEKAIAVKKSIQLAAINNEESLSIMREKCIRDCERDIKFDNIAALRANIQEREYPLDDEIKKRLIDAVLVMNDIPNKRKPEFITTILNGDQQAPLGVAALICHLAKDPVLAEQTWTKELDYKQSLIKDYPKLVNIVEVQDLKSEEKSLDVVSAIQNRSFLDLNQYMRSTLGVWYQRCATNLESQSREHKPINKETLKTAIACYEKAANIGDMDAATKLAEIYQQGNEVACKDVGKALKYYQLGDHQRYGNLVQTCFNDFKKVMESQDLEELYQLVDDYHYPLNEIGRPLLDFVMTELRCSTQTKYEIIFALASRGLECPNDMLLQTVFREIQTKSKATAHVIDQVVQSDKNPVAIMTDYLGIQMQGNQSLFWQKNSSQITPAHNASLQKNIP